MSRTMPVFFLYFYCIAIHLVQMKIMWRKGFLGFALKNLRFCTLQTIYRTKTSEALHPGIVKPFYSSPTAYSKEERQQTLRLWSDSGGYDVVSSPFDDLGAWHEAEANSFLHNVSVDSVGSSSNLGKKLVNEDRFKLLELHPDLYYFAVFDGHGGSEAVDFVQDKLHKIIKQLHKNNKDLEEILATAFEECNHELEKHIRFLINEKGHHPSIAGEGTTATVTLLRDGSELAVASVGDSRALLCRNGETMCLTDDHHPVRGDEHERILSNNGWVDWESPHIPRVNGRLAMTRSLGDFDVKPYGVIATPETTVLKVDHQTDAFLELHTDGISHVMSSTELGFIVRMCSDPEQAANTLTSCALQYGTEDNVTSIVVPLGAWRKFCSHNFMTNNIMRINCI